MAKPILNKKKAHALSFALFLIGLAFLIYLKISWWPAIMLVIGLPLAFRQYLLGRRYDMGISLLVFAGTFFAVQFNLAWEVLLPLFLTVGGLYIFLKEFIAPTDAPAETSEKEEK